MSDTIDLREAVQIVRRRMWLVIIAAAVCAGIFYGVLAFAVKPVYSAQAMLLVSSAANSQGISINDINASQKLVNTCIVLLRDGGALERAAKACGISADAEELKQHVVLRSVNNTEIFSITVKWDKPEIAAQLANELANAAPSELSRVVRGGSVEVLNPARTPDQPSGISPALGGIAGLIVGGVLSALTLLAVGIFRNRILDEADMLRHYQLPVLGTVKLSGINNETQISSEDAELAALGLLGDAPSTNGGVSQLLSGQQRQAFACIRTGLMFALEGKVNRCVSMCGVSAQGTEAEICAGLACAEALAEQSVLLIDANLQFPTLHTLFGCRNTKGLSAVLNGFCALEEAIIYSAAQGVDLLTAGAPVPNTSELLASAHFTDVLEMLGAQYDRVLIRCPSADGSADAAAIARKTAGMMLTVVLRHTSHTALQKTIQEMEFAGAALLGTVLTESED